MFDVGFSEVFLLAVLGLLVLGPERLPAVARTLGSWVRRGRKMAAEFQRELEKEVDLQSIKDLQNELNDVAAPFKEAAQTLDQGIEKGQAMLNRPLEFDDTITTDAPVAKTAPDTLEAHEPIPDTEVSVTTARTGD